MSTATLIWPLRSSFVSYIEALPDGMVEAGNGARRQGRNFMFPGHSASGGGFGFEGWLHFAGHHGSLDITLESLEVQTEGANATLWTVVSGYRMRMATMSGVQVSGEVLLHSDAVRLTGDGAHVLGGVYAPGAELEPLTIRTVR
ncbi:HtaA domain-containing protein [Paeniglutamicibacter psychrophenolicus]|uniref:HtaA domain-containing protein n=1 Tax=Paeniglutamicibacter psychrophenolicus TaxID=257454 RepID=UPI00278362C0|nr:HtaA domain-containing protein [Paeniglutamicibacter psychrophenolicus]MDQ0092231.1 hypothetical protein [Paeniglutamicibacter psychrophenolicus]